MTQKTTLVSIQPVFKPSIHSSIQPAYRTTSHSQPLASYNSCLETLQFCAVSCQLWYRRSLAAHSCTQSSHLKLGLPTGRLPVNSACMLFGVYGWERVFVHVQPAVVSKSRHVSAETNLEILSVSTVFASYHWINSSQNSLLLCHY